MTLRRYAVFGHPVAHSRSPAIHAAFARQFGIALDYDRIDASPDDFAEAVARFGRAGGAGANVTLPHKSAAATLCATLGERARRAGAANTLVRVDDGPDGTPRWHGENTDGIGLVRDLRDRHGVQLDGARVLLIGAGGAAAGIAPALLDAGVAGLAITNRGADRLAALVAHLGDPRVAACGWAAPAGAKPGQLAGVAGACGVVINTTSAARGDDAIEWPLPDDLPPGWAAVDLGYGDAARPFLDAAAGRRAGSRIDGLGMLVEQAAESFRLWHGRMPDTAPVHALLRRELALP